MHADLKGKLEILVAMKHRQVNLYKNIVVYKNNVFFHIIHTCSLRLVLQVLSVFKWFLYGRWRFLILPFSEKNISNSIRIL